nr:hypothetical protein [Tanacetum cinerariifolium]
IVCPPGGNNLSWNYLKHVDDVNGLQKKNWATHALDNLVHGIDTYKNGRRMT